MARKAHLLGWDDPDRFRHKFYAEKRKRLGKSKPSPKPRDERKRTLVQLIIEMKEKGKQRSDTPREMKTARCIRRLVDRGVMEPGELSPSHANYIAREEFGYREETPRTRWECEHALQEVQTDGSVSKYFRPWKVSDDGKDVLLKASGRPLRYKGREDGHTKLILWQFQDKYSRLRTVRGIPGKAESTPMVLAHMNFWLNRPEDTHPMRHLPWEFAHDNGAPFRTQEWENLLIALDMDPIADDRSSMPYEKTGIGSIENRWKRMWALELEWSEDYPRIWLSEYNDLVHAALAEEVEDEHPYFDGYKGDLYQQSLLRQNPRPRVLQQDIFELACRRYERTVTGELTISIDNIPYRVPQRWAGTHTIGRRVIAWKNWRGQLVATLKDYPAAEAFPLEPFAHRVKGDFSGGHQRTYTQKIKDQIASGSGMYEAIMTGRMQVGEDGEYIHSETGEIIEPPSTPTRLMPADEAIQPDSPFAGRSEQGEADRFDTAYDAQVWIGKQLAPWEISYADVADYFAPRLEHEFDLQRDRIAREVQKLTEDFKQQSKTG